MNIKTERFVEWVNGKGTITYRKNPFKANYFIGESLANNWRIEKCLANTDFRVVGFEEIENHE